MDREAEPHLDTGARAPANAWVVLMNPPFGRSFPLPGASGIGADTDAAAAFPS